MTGPGERPRPGERRLERQHRYPGRSSRDVNSADLKLKGSNPRRSSNSMGRRQRVTRANRATLGGAEALAPVPIAALTAGRVPTGIGLTVAEAPATPELRSPALRIPPTGSDVVEAVTEERKPCPDVSLASLDGRAIPPRRTRAGVAPPALGGWRPAGVPPLVTAERCPPARSDITDPSSRVEPPANWGESRSGSPGGFWPVENCNWAINVWMLAPSAVVDCDCSPGTPRAHEAPTTSA
jgi:hypothetical protein